MITIEFTGVPGSGKSFFLDKLAKENKSRGEKKYAYGQALLLCLNRTFLGTCFKLIFPPETAEYFLKKIFYYFLRYVYFFQFSASNFRLVLEVIKSQFNFNNTLKFIFFHYDWFIEVSACYQLFLNKLTNQETVVFDEGLIHKTYNLYLSKKREPSLSGIERYLDRLPKLDYLILLSVDLNTAFKRIKKRGLPKILQGCGDREIMSYLKKAQKINQFILRYYKRNKRVKILHSENNLEKLSHLR